MQVIPVQSADQHQAFLNVPFHIYKTDPNWIPPLYQDVEFIFDPEKNPAFQNNEAQRWILADQDGNYVGRIAAFTRSGIEEEGQPLGGIGFFECIEDQDAAFQLLGQATEWLREKGIGLADGPVNFGERDRFWGLLVEGFHPPSYLENYNPAYYQDFFEAYGFRELFRQNTYRVHREGIDLDRMSNVVGRISEYNDVAVKTLDFRQLDGFVQDFVTIYNKAWQHFDNFRPLTEEEVKTLFKEMKAVVVKEFVIFIYMEQQPAGVIVMLPDVNQILKHMNGKMGWWEKLKFLWYRKFSRLDKLKGVMMGIHPDHQNKGVDALLIYHVIQGLQHHPHFNWAELSWIGDFNPKMNNLMKKLTAETSKVHVTYRIKLED